MRRYLSLIALLLAFAAPASAQDCNASKVELFGGYAYLNAFPGNDQIRSDQLNSRYSLNGFGVNVAVNPFEDCRFKKVGFVGDFSWHKNETDLSQLMLGSTLIESAKTEIRRSRLLFGPRFSARSEETNIFAHILVGIANQQVKAKGIIPDTMLEREFEADTTDFAFAVGMGIDISVSKHFAVRVIQADYTPYRGDRNQEGTEKSWSHDFRLQFGIVYRWGLR